MAESRGIEPVKFYGAQRSSSEKTRRRKKSRILQNIENCPNIFERKTICPEFKSRIDGPSRVWKVFKRQQAALDFAKDYKDVGVFSYEMRITGKEGQRMYQVAHIEHMWLVHRNRPLSERCTYEVILEDSPCKLYMDLEYNLSLNPEKDGNDMVKMFIECTNLCLKEVYDIDCNASQVLWLDSSTSSKFSCHLIFQLSDCVFKDNREAGKFVQFVCTKILRSKEQLCNDKEKQQNQDIKQRFWSEAHDFLSIQNDKGHFGLFCDLCKVSKLSRAALQSVIILYLHAKRVIWHSQDLIYGWQASPYPEVDEFIREQISRGEKNGYIRHWRYFKDTEVLQYSIGNFRFCRNIGRHHKSNNIMIIVQLRERQFYQKCFDPECRGFRSISFPLPLHATPAYFFIEEDSFSDMHISEQSLADKELWADDVWEDQSFVSKATCLLEEAEKNASNSAQ